MTVKYSSAGALLWTNRYPGLGIKNGHNQPRALALDAGGNVVVTGASCGIGGVDIWFWDIATVAYSRSGMPLWTNRYNGPGNQTDYAWQVAVDASNNVYVAGVSETGDSNNDLRKFAFTAVKYVVPPIITRQPLSCTNTVGSTASFSVEAAGALPLSYQWRKGDGNLLDGGFTSGVNTTNLMIRDIQLADEGDYSVVVNNVFGTATGTVVHLTVVVPPNHGRFTNLSYSRETRFTFIFRDGTVGQPYRIQTSATGLQGSWTDWQSFTYSAPAGFMDVSATGAERRYYRAITP